MWEAYAKSFLFFSLVYQNSATIQKSRCQHKKTYVTKIYKEKQTFSLTSIVSKSFHSVSLFKDILFGGCNFVCNITNFCFYWSNKANFIIKTNLNQDEIRDIYISNIYFMLYQKKKKKERKKEKETELPG